MWLLFKESIFKSNNKDFCQCCHHPATCLTPLLISTTTDKQGGLCTKWNDPLLKNNSAVLYIETCPFSFFRDWFMVQQQQQQQRQDRVTLSHPAALNYHKYLPRQDIVGHCWICWFVFHITNFCFVSIAADLSLLHLFYYFVCHLHTFYMLWHAIRKTLFIQTH